MTSLVAVIYTHSPVHTDEYYVAKARAIAKAGADRIFIKDVDGLLVPERVRTLVPELLRAVDGIPAIAVETEARERAKVVATTTPIVEHGGFAMDEPGR